MPKLIIEKGNSYETSIRKNEIEKLLDKRFDSLEEIADNLPGGCYIPKAKEVEITDLPYTIREWPVYERAGALTAIPIAKIKVVG